MPRVPKTETTAAYTRPSTFVSLLSGWVQQGLDSFFATQRILVDLAIRQNTSAIKTFREGITESEASDSVSKILMEIAVEGTSNYIEAQHLLLDMAEQENEILMNGVKQRVGENETAMAVTNVVRRSVETFIEMQQNFLMMAKKRTQGYLQGADGDRKGLVDMASEAMEEFANAQKRFLDVISEETSGKKKDHQKVPRTTLVELGQAATESFIEAQKKLLDLAGQQVNVSMQAATRALELNSPVRLMPMAEVAGESIRSFVDAEKALLHTMKKVRTQATAQPESPRPHRGRRVKSRKEKAAAA